MLLRMPMLWSVRGFGDFHVVQPTGQTFRKKSESRHPTKKRGSAENETYDQR
jgi:hypothetical protein